MHYLFTSILFLVLVLLLIGFSPIANENNWISSPHEAFGIAMGVYAIVVAVIAIQNKLLKKSIRNRKHLLLAMVNFDMLAFLLFYHFIIAGHRVFQFSSGMNVFFSLSLYLFALYVFHFTSYPFLSHSSRGITSSSYEYAMLQVRFLIPFFLPFLFFSLLIDLLSLYPDGGLDKILFQNVESITTLAILFCLMGCFIVATILFFPPLIQKIWKCKPIKNPDLKQSLEAICRKANFRHAGMMTWTVMNHTYTAGIIGVLPRFRYVMFTRKLLDGLSIESIEAILAHEIGHSYRKHLLIYPFIICGMIVATALFSLFFSEGIDEFFILQDILHPSSLWMILYPFAILIPYALIAAIYFRLVFGYYSRLFERQADLHVFELDLPPESMYLALDELGQLTGNSHNLPSWHHHSIRERMIFLNEAASDNSLVHKHHRRVKKNVGVYFFILTIFTGLAISPLLIDIPLFTQLAQFSNASSGIISSYFNSDLRNKLADSYIKNYQLPGDSQIVHSLLLKNMKNFRYVSLPGAIEYLTAKDLLLVGEYRPSAKLMSVVWSSMDEKLKKPEVLNDFSLLTEQIIREYHGPETEELKKNHLQALQKMGRRK
jgi:STE24 endopeptidase